MKGTTVQLLTKTLTGYNRLHEPIYVEKWEEVSDVLIGSPSTDDVINSLNLYGKRLEYVLGIPKGDKHNWTDTEVVFWGKRFRTFGFPTTGEKANIPLRWGQNVKVESYGEEGSI